MDAEEDHYLHFLYMQTFTEHQMAPWVIENDLDNETPCIYSIPCEYGKVNIGQTSHSTNTRFNECHHHI
jgi:hypothetical protein